ncbi:MAG: hypothetical protein MK102_16370 [Fuerstiella sp.]|nr:hypothetical protein [Fuerstiella sp.]
MTTLNLLAIVWWTQLSVSGAIPIWQLSKGQTFSVQVTTHRVTEIQIGNHTDVSDVTDRVLMQYKMSGYDRSGRARLQVQIRSLNRTTIDNNGEQTTQSLDAGKVFRIPAVVLLVSDRGNAVKVVASDSVFRFDTPQSHHVLTQICSEDVFRSWLDLPFRVPVAASRPPFRPFSERRTGNRTTKTESQNPPTEDAAEESSLSSGTEWTRTQFVSLGVPGTARCDCVCFIDSIENLEATFSVQGTTRMVPHQFNEDLPLKFQGFQLNTSEFSGSGQILMDELTQLPKSIQLDQKMTLAGHTIVFSGGSAHELRFKQSLTQSSNTSEFVVTDSQNGVPVNRASADQR